MKVGEEVKRGIKGGRINAKVKLAGAECGEESRRGRESAG